LNQLSQHRNELLERPTGRGNGSALDGAAEPHARGDATDAAGLAMERDSSTRGPTPRAQAIEEPRRQPGKQRGTPFRKGDPRTVESARKGGIASREAARRRQAESGWEWEYAKLCDEDPARTARKVYGLTNGLAWVKGLELAQVARAGRLKERELALREREWRVDRFEQDVDSIEAHLEAVDEALEQRTAELRELEQRKQALSAAIEAEAAAAGFELVEEEEEGEDAVAEA
jgi:hypothetical protein